MSTLKLKVAVVGGGPAGAATAMSLAQQGHTVTLYEAYPPPLQIPKTSPKAYVISLGKRGQDGLVAATGIQPETVHNAIYSPHMVRQTLKKPQLYTRYPSLVVQRKALAAHILNQAQQAGVTIHYQHRLVDIDFEKRQIRLQQQSKDDVVVNDDDKNHDKNAEKTVIVQDSYDLLVGADGGKSKVRQIMHEKLHEFHVLRTEEDTMEYQVAVIPSTPFTQWPSDSIYTWNSPTYNAISLAYPLPTSEYIFAIVFPQGKLAEFRKAHQETGHGYDEALASLYPNLDQATKDILVTQLVQGEAANGGMCVWTSCLGSQGVALVGDSAHGMWPSLGQGANCALESAAVFVQSCKDVVEANASTTTLSNPADIANAIVAEFDKRRYVDATAAVDLTYGGIGAKTARGRQNAPLVYKLQVMGMMLLHKVTLGMVPKPALLRLMAGDNISYATAHKFHFVYEKMICVSAVAVLSLPVVARYWLAKK